MSFVRDEEQVVAWVNRERKCLFRDSDPILILPKGERASRTRCPVAKAFGPWCAVSTQFYGNVLSRGEGGAISVEQIGRLPEFVRDFIGAFDAGKYPWMEER